MTLMTFLLCARQLLWKSRRILLGDASSLEVSPYLLTDTAAAMLMPLGLSGAAGVTSVGHLGANVQAMVVHQAAAAAASSTGIGGVGGVSAGSRASMAMNGAVANGSVGGGSGVGGAASMAAQRRSVNDNVAVNAAALQAAGGGAGGVGAGANGGNGLGGGGGGGANGGALNGVAGGDANYLIWQAEMEKGYESLVNSIFPYICDLREAASLAPKPRL